MFHVSHCIQLSETVTLPLCKSQHSLRLKLVQKPCRYPVPFGVLPCGNSLLEEYFNVCLAHFPLFTLSASRLPAPRPSLYCLSRQHVCNHRGGSQQEIRLHHNWCACLPLSCQSLVSDILRMIPTGGGVRCTYLTPLESNSDYICRPQALSWPTVSLKTLIRQSLCSRPVPPTSTTLTSVRALLNVIHRPSLILPADLPASYGRVFGNPAYDWSFSTVRDFLASLHRCLMRRTHLLSRFRKSMPMVNRISGSGKSYLVDELTQGIY